MARDQGLGLSRETSGGYGRPADGAAESRVSRTFCARPTGVKGFCKNAVPFRTPSLRTTSCVCPDMNMTFRPGRSLRAPSASSRPPSSGMTTSDISRSMGPWWDSHSARPSRPLRASRTTYPLASRTFWASLRTTSSSSTRRMTSEPLGAFASLLRRKERLEDLRPHLRVYSNPGVMHGHRHVAPRRKPLTGGIGLRQSRVSRFNGQRTASGHRVPCVQRKVHDRAADFARVGPHLPEGGIAIDGDLDPLAHQTAQHLVEVRDDGVQVEHLRLKHLTPAEGQQIGRAHV